MKKIIYLLLAVLATSFISCSKSDEPMNGYNESSVTAAQLEKAELFNGTGHSGYQLVFNGGICYIKKALTSGEGMPCKYEIKQDSLILYKATTNSRYGACKICKFITLENGEEVMSGINLTHSKPSECGIGILLGMYEGFWNPKEIFNY